MYIFSNSKTSPRGGTGRGHPHLDEGKATSFEGKCFVSNVSGLGGKELYDVGTSRIRGLEPKVRK